MYSNYFLTLVKEITGSFTLLVVPRVKGVTTKHMTMSGSTTAGTAFVDFDDVEVPLSYVVGERGNGFKYIVSNFNHEAGVYQRCHNGSLADYHDRDCSLVSSH